MQAALNVVLSVELALLFVHEMDAVRRQEWKMFIILKDMKDEKAYRVFVLLHIPLYVVILALLFSRFFVAGNYIVDIFLVLHSLLHLGFRRHPANRLNGKVSGALIHAAGVLGLIHMAAFTFWR